MRYLVLCVEQLDRAAEELHVNSIVGSRLALILIDNVVELMLHHRSESIFSTKGAPWRDPVEGGRYSRLEQHRILGRHFDEKLKFLKAEGDLSPQEYEFIRICHSIRGEAYHAGLTREGVLFALAWEYHELTCNLFARYASRGRSYDPGAPIPPRYAKHIAECDRTSAGRAYSHGKEVEVADSLARTRPPRAATLSNTLAADLEERFARLEELVEFLVRANPSGDDLARTLYETQWWHDLFSDVPLDIEERSAAYQEHIRQKATEMRVSWKPQYTTLPLDSWKRRTANMRSADRFSALARYEQLIGEIEYMVEAVEKSAGALEAEIDAQIARSLMERSLAKTAPEK